MGQSRKHDFHIGVGALRYGVETLLDKEILQGCDKLARHEHHACQRLADNAVKSDQDREGDQRPEAARHGVDALFAVELLHLGIELLLISLVAALQLLDLGLQACGPHHALLALGHERSQDQVHCKRKEDDRTAIVPCQIVQPDHQPGKGFGNCTPHGCILKSFPIPPGIGS